LNEWTSELGWEVHENSKRNKACYARNPIKKRAFLTGLTGSRDGLREKHFYPARKAD
jgi:hypothetical protein